LVAFTNEQILGGIRQQGRNACGVVVSLPEPVNSRVCNNAFATRALHETLFVLTVTTQSVPWTKDAERLSFEEIAPRLWRATARYGFMERPDIPALLQRAHGLGCAIDLSEITY
jgi:K+ transporter